MGQRLNPFTVNPDAMRPWVELGKTIQTNGLDPQLRELVMTRAAQLNGCTFCMHHHLADARKYGETEDRLHLLNAWSESGLYTDRERAALAWTESLTNIKKTGAADADYELVKSQFSEAEIVNLTVMIGAINLWNRLQIAARAVHPVEQADRATA